MADQPLYLKIAPYAQARQLKKKVALVQTALFVITPTLTALVTTCLSNSILHNASHAQLELVAFSSASVAGLATYLISEHLFKPDIKTLDPNPKGFKIALLKKALVGFACGLILGSAAGFCVAAYFDTHRKLFSGWTITLQSQRATRPPHFKQSGSQTLSIA